MDSSTLGPSLGEPTLPDEASEADEQDRVGYWVDVYGQILKYKERVLTVVLQEADRIASDVARRYVMEADAQPLTRQVEVCLERYLLWVQRLEELEESEVEPRSPEPS